MRRLLILCASMFCHAGGFAGAADAAVFETPPDEAPEASLPPSQVSAGYFHIRAPVHSDGLMHHYVIESRFGVFAAYGRDALAVRLQEVAALNDIAETSDAEVALQAVGRDLQENVSSIVRLAENPVGAVTGIPEGIAHLFAGYQAQAEEVSAEIHKETHQGGGSEHPASNVAGKAGTAAKKYVDHYFGQSAAEMRWYKKLAVDPYTDNQVLRRAVSHLAKVDATVHFGMRFAHVHGIPYAGEIRRALNAIYNEDPAVLRKRRREALGSFGLAPEEIARFENALLLSPTRQTVLVDAAKALDGVANRAELFRHASSVTSEEEIAVFLNSTAMLVRFHAQHPVARIVAGLQLPTAQLADGSIEAFGAFDALYWTEEVAGYERSAVQALPADAPAREMWLEGSVSTLARGEAERRGWRIHDQAGGSEAPPADIPRARPATTEFGLLALGMLALMPRGSSAWRLAPVRCSAAVRGPNKRSTSGFTQPRADAWQGWCDPVVSAKIPACAFRHKVMWSATAPSISSPVGQRSTCQQHPAKLS